MEMQKKQKTPDIPLLWDVRRKILNVLPPNFRNIILLCRNAVSLFPNTPDFHRIYSYPDNVGHTATVTTASADSLCFSQIHSPYRLHIRIPPPLTLWIAAQQVTCLCSKNFKMLLL